MLDELASDLRPKYVLVANYVVDDTHGLPNVMGIWDLIITSDQPPVTLPPLNIVCDWRVSVAVGSDHHVLFGLVDEDEHVVAETPEQPIRFAPRIQGPGLASRFVFSWPGIVVHRGGGYELRTVVNGIEVRSYTLDVVVRN